MTKLVLLGFTIKQLPALSYFFTNTAMSYSIVFSVMKPYHLMTAILVL